MKDKFDELRRLLEDGELALGRAEYERMVREMEMRKRMEDAEWDWHRRNAEFWTTRPPA